jgi:hypothetical protein
MVGLVSQQTGEVTPLVFRNAKGTQALSLPALVTVTGPETNVAAACAGLRLRVFIDWVVERYRGSAVS